MKTAAAPANIIHLDAFRQKRGLAQKTSEPHSAEGLAAPSYSFVVPVWLCWVPMWTPFVG